MSPRKKCKNVSASLREIAKEFDSLQHNLDRMRVQLRGISATHPNWRATTRRTIRPRARRNVEVVDVTSDNEQPSTSSSSSSSSSSASGHDVGCVSDVSAPRLTSGSSSDEDIHIMPTRRQYDRSSSSSDSTTSGIASPSSSSSSSSTTSDDDNQIMVTDRSGSRSSGDGRRGGRASSSASSHSSRTSGSGSSSDEDIVVMRDGAASSSSDCSSVTSADRRAVREAIDRMTSSDSSGSSSPSSRAALGRDPPNRIRFSFSSDDSADRRPLFNSSGSSSLSSDSRRIVRHVMANSSSGDSDNWSNASLPSPPPLVDESDNSLSDMDDDLYLSEMSPVSVSSGSDSSDDDVQVYGGQNMEEDLPDVDIGEFTDNPGSTINLARYNAVSDTVDYYCPVCLDNYVTLLSTDRGLMSTLCGHIFCDRCITKAVKRKHVCPVCHKKTTRKEIHPLYIN